MKIKSLLVLAAGVIALNANAQYQDETFDQNVILSGEVLNADGEALEELQAGVDFAVVEISMTRDEEAADLLPNGERAGDNFTNVQFNLLFPQDAAGKGLRPCTDEGNEDPEGYWTDELSGVRDKRGNVVCSFSTNFIPSDAGDKYPEYTVVGANTKKVKITTNPTSLLSIYVKADEGMLTGAYDLKYNTLKYTAYSDEKVQNLEGGVLCSINVKGATGVQDVNAAKAVASVKYINAAGMTSNNAFEGVNIVVTKYVDGTQSVAKVVK